jgi:hypothetical protein
MSLDDLLFAIIVAGIGLSGAYLKAEYVLNRYFKTAEHKKLIALRELHTNRLKSRQINRPVAALRNHQPFISKESALCAPDEWLCTVYLRKSADVGIARHRELA